MNSELTKQENRTLYWIGWSLLAVAVCIWIFLKCTHFNIFSYMPGCLFNTFTGMYCPGCGGTRAVVALFHGDILASIYYHPVVLYCVVLYAWYMLSHTIEIISKDKYKIGLKYKDRYLYIAVGIVIFHFIEKNILLLFWGISM